MGRATAHNTNQKNLKLQILGIHAMQTTPFPPIPYCPPYYFYASH